MNYHYYAYGLTVRLPFPCAPLPLAPKGTVPDVIIEDGLVHRQLTTPTAKGDCWQAEPGRFLWLGGRHAGRFMVEGGNQVILQRSPAAETAMLACHFLGAVLGAVLRHRVFLVLHANAAVTPTGAVTIAGESGAGKSTTLAALLRRGCPMLSDDITALRLGPDGRVETLPGVPQLHLTEDSALVLNQDICGLPRYPWRRMKVAIPAQTMMSAAPAPLRALYLLQITPTEDLSITSLTGAEKFNALLECIYGPLLSQDHPELFPIVAAFTAQVVVFRVERPAHRWTIDQVVDSIIGRRYSPCPLP
jgi:hypothetical protein